MATYHCLTFEAPFSDLATSTTRSHSHHSITIRHSTAPTLQLSHSPLQNSWILAPGPWLLVYLETLLDTQIARGRSNGDQVPSGICSPLTCPRVKVRKGSSVKRKGGLL